MKSLFLLSGLLLCGYLPVAVTIADSIRLAADLLPTYRKSDRPGAKENVTDVVKLALSIDSLAEVTNPPNSTLVTGTMQLVWTDSRLSWNVTKYGTSRISLPMDSIWVPKITGTTIMHLDKEMQHPKNPSVEIDASGQVYWNTEMTLKFYDRTPEKDDIINGWFEIYIADWKAVDVDIQPLTGIIDHSAVDGSKDLFVHTGTLTRKIWHFECCPGDFPRITVDILVMKKGARLRRILNMVQNWAG